MWGRMEDGASAPPKDSTTRRVAPGLPRPSTHRHAMMNDQSLRVPSAACRGPSGASADAI